MKKINVFGVVFLLAFMSLANFRDENQSHELVLSSETSNLMQANGFSVLGACYPVRSPRMLDSTNLPETSYIRMSLDVRQARNLQITWLGTPVKQKMAASQNDILLSENFEGDFPGANWHRSGNPTWGKSTYQKHGGQNSVFCAKDSTAGVTPPANYPNDMNAMMVFGPFDLSDASLAFVRFWFWLETEVDKDIFWYGASSDGNIFGVIGVSVSTGTYSPAWEQTSLNLADVPKLGSLIGQSSIWIAFGFTSDSTGAMRGAFVDDVEVQKAAVGTGISGYLKGSLSPAGNPYIAFDHVGVAQGDSLEILPGCELRFDAAKEFVNQGYLAAVGTEKDSIRFTSNSPNPKPGDWVGIGFYSSTSEGTLLQYSIIEFGGGGSRGSGILIDETSQPQIISNSIRSNNYYGIRNSAYSYQTWITVTIIENEIYYNNVGIYIYWASGEIKKNIIKNNIDGLSFKLSDPIIEENQIVNNDSRGIYCYDSKPKIISNRIEENGSNGIEDRSGLYPMTGDRIIAGNKIFKNIGHGIDISGLGHSGSITQNLIVGNKDGIHLSPGYYGNIGSIRLYNNTIANNRVCGIDCGEGNISGTPITGNIITSNYKAGIYAHHESNEIVNVAYNNVFENTINFEITKQDSLGILILMNSNGDSCDRYFNISKDPLFVDPANENYHLQYIEKGFPENSPCRDAGNSHTIFNDGDGSQNDLGYTGGSCLFISHKSYDFGSREVGFAKEFKLYFYNDRFSTVSVSKLVLTDSDNFNVIPNSAFDLAPFEVASFTITFTPKAVREFQSKVHIISENDFFGSDTVSVDLYGTGKSVTVIAGGYVTGIWTKENNPYLITGTATVPKGDSLIIKQGVYIRFEGHECTLLINGKLKAIGTPSDSIIITRTDKSSGAGIKFVNSDYGSLIEYCIIKSQGNGIYCDNTSITVRKSMLLGNSATSGGGIFLKNSSSKIENNTIENNRAYEGSYYAGGGAIYCIDSTPKIYGNLIKNNFATNRGGGIHSVNSNLQLFNNIVCYNEASEWASGIYIQDSKADCINNIVFKNDGYPGAKGIAWRNSSGNIINCIIRENLNGYTDPKLKQLTIESISTSTRVKYNDIQAGWEGEGNIDVDALFFDPANNDFRLQPNSPCIDAGNPDSLYNDSEDPTNPGFALWPAQGTIRNDMGAYGGPYAAGSSINFKPNAFSLLLPADGDTLNTQAPIFKWRRSVDPNPGDYVNYTAQIDLKQDFLNPISLTNIADTTYQLQMNLPADLTYYWRVIASDSAGLQRTSKEVFHFTIGNVAPQPFNLFQPENKDTVFTLSPQLDWAPAEDPNFGDAIRYTIFYAQDSSFVKADTMKDIASHSFQCDRLADHQNYFWKVKAEDNQGASTFCNQVFQFYTFAAPLAFKLLSPASEDTVATDTLSFSWQSAFDPNPADTIRYTLLCDSSRSFAKPIMVTGISDTSFAFSDSLKNNTRYFWTVLAVDKDSFTTASSDTFSFLVRYLPTGVAGTDDFSIPTEFSLSQNYPNPFNPVTTIDYQLPLATETRLEIFNLRGQRVATLVDCKQAAGYYTVTWDGKDGFGNPVASGLYLFRLETKEFTKVRKLALIK